MSLAAAIPDAELVRIADVGHMIMLEDPNALADLIEAAGHAAP